MNMGYGQNSSYVVEKQANGKYLLNDGDCNISYGFLEAILKTRDGAALAKLYEETEKVSYNTEYVVRSWRSNFVTEINH